MYDSLKGTVDHINNVRTKLNLIVNDLLVRMVNHDKSKTESPEKEGYDVFTPRLKESVYGSDEYWNMLGEMAPILNHHYQNNSHHPDCANLMRANWYTSLPATYLTGRRISPIQKQTNQIPSTIMESRNYS